MKFHTESDPPNLQETTENSTNSSARLPQTQTMLRILAFGEQQVQEGKVVPLAEAAEKLRARFAERSS